MIKRKILAIFAIFLSLLTFNVYAQQQSQDTHLAKENTLQQEDTLMELRVFFKENSAVIDPKYLPEIDKVANSFLKQLDTFVDIESSEPNNPKLKFAYFFDVRGYTNKNEASKKSNAKLAHKRAIVIKKAIISSIQKIGLQKYGTKKFVIPEKKFNIVAEKKPYKPYINEHKELDAVNRVVVGRMYIEMCCVSLPVQNQ